MSRRDQSTGGRTAYGSLYVPAGRNAQRLSRLSRDQLQRRADAAASAADHAAARRDRDERAARYLPPGGETGPAALRSYRRFAVRPHRATSAVLSVAYPFLAEAGLGGDGILIGRDTYSGGSFVFDPWVLYNAGVLSNPNVLLAGVIGTGKSMLGKSLITRSIAFGRRAYVPGDPKGEWTAVAEAVGGRAISLGPGMPTRLNPLDAGIRPPDLSDTMWTSVVWQRRRELLGSLTETVLGRHLEPVEHTALDAALGSACTESDTPTLPRVVAHLLEPPHDDPSSSAAELRRDGRAIAHALRRLVHGDLAGLFDGPSTIAVDPALPLVSLDLSRVNGSDTLLALIMTCGSAWMEASLAHAGCNAGSGQRWVVYDEAWRIMRQPSLIRRMQSQWKLSRAYGIANLMIIHRLSDLDAVGDAASETRALANGLLADCSTRIVYRQESDQLGATASLLGLTSTERAVLIDLSVGEGLWRVANRAFRVQHQITVGELERFDTTAAMRAG
jgi:type IV secretory pathway VirB4 component